MSQHDFNSFLDSLAKEANETLALVGFEIPESIFRSIDRLDACERGELDSEKIQNFA